MPGLTLTKELDEPASSTPLGGWIAPRIPKQAFERTITRLFGPQTRPSPALLQDFWALVNHHNGRAISHNTGRFYIDRLALRPPEVAYDLPTGGRRLLQRARGYRHTFVAGTEVLRVKLPLDAERYLRTNYTVATGPLTAGTFTAFLAHDRQASRAYASGFTVS